MEVMVRACRPLLSSHHCPGVTIPSPMATIVMFEEDGILGQPCKTSRHGEDAG